VYRPGRGVEEGEGFLKGEEGTRGVSKLCRDLKERVAYAKGGRLG